MNGNQAAETKYFKSLADDFVRSKKQSYRLPESFVWIHTGLCYRVTARYLFLLFQYFALLYCRFVLHVKMKNRSVLRQSQNTGYFLYANHTQPIGDAFMPVRVLSPKRAYIVASPANLGIPVLGPLLPLIGALPLPESIGGIKKLCNAIHLRIAQKSCVVFYPEAHVWPWYTGIRPFPTASFGFPVECDAPSYCMTTTYQKRDHRERPGITIYLDGPYYPDRSLPKMKRKEKLRDDIYRCMERNSLNSTYSYIQYRKEIG
jgi:1-acyl-sn-glycerol-3-phosphate acyltransferase